MIELFVNVAAVLLGQAQAGPPCAYDRARMMSLDQQAFDQDLDGGWRPLASRDGCRLVAADLIRDYREARRSEDRILYWHEGQLRALDGQTEAAKALLERARRQDDDPIGWNHYVDATIAFLNKDRLALLAARERLARQPRPEAFPSQDSQGRPISWPLNLRIVDRFLACFGQPYSDALGETACN